MNTKQQALTVLLALIAGLAGGVVSSHFFVDDTVIVEKPVQHQKVVTAEEFQLVDEEKKTRATLKLDAHRRTSLSLINEEGVAVAKLESSKDGSSLTLSDQHGRDRIWLMASEILGEAYLYMVDYLGMPRCVLHADKDGKSYLYMNDPNRVPRISFGVEADGTPSIEVKDKNGNSRAVLGIARLTDKRTGNIETGILPSLVLLNEKGEVLWSEPKP
jgi:hypothetical protein